MQTQGKGAFDLAGFIEKCQRMPRLESASPTRNGFALLRYLQQLPLLELRLPPSDKEEQAIKNAIKSGKTAEQIIGSSGFVFVPATARTYFDSLLPLPYGGDTGGFCYGASWNGTTPAVLAFPSLHRASIAAENFGRAERVIEKVRREKNVHPIGKAGLGMDFVAQAGEPLVLALDIRPYLGSRVYGGFGRLAHEGNGGAFIIFSAFISLLDLAVVGKMPFLEWLVEADPENRAALQLIR
jgi:hypothetical protein